MAATATTAAPLLPPSAGLRLTGRGMPRELAAARRPNTVRRILRAAEEIFAERGLSGARTSAIARGARVNQALLYYYFQSKEELHRFTLEMLFSQLRAQATSALEAHGTPRERLLGYVNAYFDFVAAHPNYPRLVERELMSRGPRLGGVVENYFRPLHGRLTAAIRGGIARGQFRRVDPGNTVVTLIAMTVFYFAAAPVLGELWRCDPLTPRRVAARRRAVLDFLEHGLFLRRARTR
jgi:TetR/AcrR family transcriptional regulator